MALAVCCSKRPHSWPVLSPSLGLQDGEESLITGGGGWGRRRSRDEPQLAVGVGGLLCHSHHFSVTWSKDFLSWASVSLLEKHQMDQRTIGQCLSNFNVHTGDVCVCVLVAQSCPTLCNPTDCSLPGSSVHGVLQVRILEWVAIPFSIIDHLESHKTAGPDSVDLR